ncbi:MAG TPA: polysaccharide deacetylase family protein [Nitrospira sp.]|nr:polysaccharide deacetylase family protein [Nitrospira sp.]
MRLFQAAVLLAFSLSLLNTAMGQTRTTAERLGYPRDAKLLIIHADDLAVAHSEDMASFDALNRHAVTSASIMVPCPWLTEVAEYAKAHPDADLGLHLTVTSEWKTYRWGPVASKGKVPSLLDGDGYLWPENEPATRNIKAEDAEREIRAQIEKAMAMGIHPTHVDSHMGEFFERPDLFAVYLKVAHEYKLPFLAALTPNVSKAMTSQLSPGDVVLDNVLMAYPETVTADWKTFYLNSIKNLKPGVTELIVHLAHDDSEMQAITVDHPDYGAAWRQRDYNVITSAEFKQALEENHVILIHWSDIKKLIQ